MHRDAFIAPRVLVAQIGARRHYAVATALSRTGLLESLLTDIDARAVPWRWLNLSTLRGSVGDRLRKLSTRVAPDVPAERVAGMGLVDLLRSRLGNSGGTVADRWSARNAAFCQWVVRHGIGEADTVYAYNGAALEILREARKEGLYTVLDQTAAPWAWNARLLREESQRWKGWEDEPGELDASGSLAAREEAEWSLADAIVCGSNFCRSTLIESGVQSSKCHVLQYPPVSGGVSLPRGDNTRDRMRVLFAGTLQLRKGIQYLYEAARCLVGKSSIEFRLVGPCLLSDKARGKLAAYFDVRGSVPRSRMVEHYAWADMLVLPTLSEGSANVCHEAMAAGLPVITTPAAGSLVRDGKDGLIVPERDIEALVKALSFMAANPRTRRRFGDSARAEMEEARRMDAYSGRLCALLVEIASVSNERPASVSCG